MVDATLGRLLDPLLPQSLDGSVVEVAEQLLVDLVLVDGVLRQRDGVLTLAKMSDRREVAVLSRHEVGVGALHDKAKVLGLLDGRHGLGYGYEPVERKWSNG